MKNPVRCILFVCFSLVLLPFASCNREQEQHRPFEGVVDIDSLFIDLGKPLVEKRIATVDEAFTKIYKEKGLNGTVLYAEGGKVIFRKAFGWRNLVAKQKDSLQIDDQFQLASVSKMFTAEAIMLLHSQGKLDYEDHITKYIPEFPYQGITIRNLLNHRSGLSRYETLSDEQWPDRTVPISNEEVIKLYCQHQPDPYNKPNVTFHYTNVNYVLLASIVERITGEHFEDFVKENIFKPLGMDHSYIYSLRGVSKLETYMSTDVQGHDLLKKGARRAQDDYLNGVVGDKMMYSTVDDLYKFCLAIQYNLLLPEDIQQEAFVPGSPQWKSGENYGFGWRMNEKHPGYLYHFGWWKGYRSYVIRDIDRGSVLIVLTNTDSGIIGEALWDFVNDTTDRIPEASLNPNLAFD